MKWLRRSGLAFGIAAMGLLAGWLTGQSGFGEAVTAALLSATAPIVGGGALTWYAFHPDAEYTGFIGIMVALFALAIAIGSQVGLNQSRQIAKNDYEEGKRLRWSHLIECSQNELRVNDYRERILRLDPLPSEAFCP